MEVAAGHRNQAVVEVRQPTRCRVRGQRLCFCVVVRVQAAVLAVCPAAVGPHLQQVRQGREGWPRARSQRTSGHSAGCSLLQEGTAH